MIVGGGTARTLRRVKEVEGRRKKHLLNKVSLNIRHYSLPKTKEGGSQKKKTQSPVSLLWREVNHTTDILIKG